MPSMLMLASMRVVFGPRLRGTEQSTPAARVATKPAGQKGRCSPPSRPRKPTAPAPPSPTPSPSRPLFGTHPVPVPPHSVFSSETHPPQEPPDGGVAQGLARCALQEVPPLGYGSCGALLYVLFEYSPGGLVHLRRSATALPRCERRASVGHSRVALDGGEADAE